MSLNQFFRLMGWVSLVLGMIGYQILTIAGNGTLDRRVTLLGSAVSGLFVLVLVPKERR